MIGVVFEVGIVEMRIFQIYFVVFEDLEGLFKTAWYLFVNVVDIGSFYIELL